MNILKNIILIAFVSIQIIGFSQAKESGKSGSYDVVAIGYQIGGYTLIGIDYEMRVHDYFGIHVGGGFKGYTIGLKIHTAPWRNSSFVNLSLKDGGFGLLTAVAAEYGGKWVFNKKNNFGLHSQIGIAKIIGVERNFERSFFGSKGAPPVMLSVGIGFSW